MLSPDFILLYVENVSTSAAFYSNLLGNGPVDNSANFAMFPLQSGVMLGLWAGHDVQPRPTSAGGGSELGFTAKDQASVDAMHKEWSERGYAIAQKPVLMDFGYTFTALDPDGHRLRVFAPKQG
ncbi:MAG TPA: VOC family protein [Fibrobacteria bacterium]|nr:VOC family protein [Fibrobacteria bacterium]